MRNDGLHAGYTANTAVGSTTSSIGVPQKGRNAGIALGEELNREDTDEILDILNGRGKIAAKTGEGFTEIWKEVKDYDFIELRDTGRKFPRPVFTELKQSSGKVRGFSGAALEQDFDKFYQGFDRLIEDQYSVEEISKDFEDLAREAADDEGYKLTSSLGYGEEDRCVKWAAMNTDLQTEPDTVLIPEEFPSIGKAVAENFWSSDPEYQTFQDYAVENGVSELDEEEILERTQEQVAGAYMYVSGGTAREEGVEYEPVPGFKSRLGRFENVR